MLLVMDVGNTNIVCGIYKQKQLVQHWQINTDQQKTEDEYGTMIKTFLREEGIAPRDVDGIIISSVVPSLMFALEKMCQKYFKLSPMVVGPGIKTGLPIQYDPPHEVGADRIVNAVGALAENQPPLLIIDFGTATTFCFIDEQGRYLGGAIAPGLHISTDSLYRHAAKLPRVDLKAPKQVIGRNTVSAMQSGIIYGLVGQVEGIVKKMKKEARLLPTVIATGAVAELISSETEMIEKVDPFLTLKGLYLIYHRNKK